MYCESLLDLYKKTCTSIANVDSALKLTLLVLSVAFRLKESTGWILAWTSNYLDHVVERIALNAKASDHSRMVAASSGSLLKLWSISHNNSTQTKQIGMLLK